MEVGEDQEEIIQVRVGTRRVGTSMKVGNCESEAGDQTGYMSDRILWLKRLNHRKKTRGRKRARASGHISLRPAQDDRESRVVFPLAAACCSIVVASPSSIAPAIAVASILLPVS